MINKYLTFKELAEKCPFSVPSLRQLRRKNTCHFKRCTLKKGHRVLVDYDQFRTWMIAHGNRIKENGRRIRGARLKSLLTREDAVLDKEIYNGYISSAPCLNKAQIRNN